MNTKYYLSLLVVIMITTLTQAQTMQWIPTPAGSDYGSCPNGPGKQKSISYVLEYTPAVSGVLTSYTTGFLVSCTSTGSAIIKNQSRVMTSKNHEASGCNTMGAVLMNCSGNSGTISQNMIEAGVPVLLHQICIAVPESESITLAEEVVTDLTTSIDLLDGTPVTEFPTYTSATIGKVRYDDGVTLILLDFQAVAAGDLVSQLDWSAESSAEPFFVVEHSLDGIHFSAIGEVIKGEKTDRFDVFQFIDQDAQYGINYYRIRQKDEKGFELFSQVRKIRFEQHPFSVTASPNPANEQLSVAIHQAKEGGTISLMDALGRERVSSEFEKNQRKLKLILDRLEPGTYTLIVTSGEDVHTEKIIIVP